MSFMTNAVKTPRLAVRLAIAALGILCVTVGPAAAQWLKIPLPGTPRMPNGSPNLSAPAPKTADGKPDLSGIWRADSGRYLGNLAGEGVGVPMHPWAAAVYKERLDTTGVSRWEVRNGLLRAGWTRNSMKVGDTVAVEATRARDGTPNANARVVILTATGQRLFAGSSEGQ